MRQGYELYHEALLQLCFAVYDWHEEVFNKLVKVLKEGKWGHGGKHWSDDEISEANMTSDFKKRFKVYLQKKIHPAETIVHKLQLWFDDFKDRADSLTGKKLFTMDTKRAVEEQKKKATFITDYLPVEDMYMDIQKGAKSTSRHDLTKKKCLRCESHVENWHNKQPHFANNNSRQQYADFLNLIGTGETNVEKRHQVWANETDIEEQADLIRYFAKVPMYYNHSELSVVNQSAVEAGCKTIPFC